MKLETQEKIKLVELLGGACATSCIAYIELFNIHNSEDINQMLGLAMPISMAPYLTNALFNLHFEKLSDEYKELSNIQKEIVDRTLYLMDELKIDDPIEMFATYVYMYRHGYLSNNKQFMYKNDMKDIANIGGIDVIRGSGVCRSISSLLTEIYREKGLNASSIGVNARDALEHKVKLCDVKPNKSIDEKTTKQADKVMKAGKTIPIVNHLVTTVTDGNKNFILDPTNDTYLIKGKFNQLMLASDKSYHMTYHPLLFSLNKTLGQVKADSAIKIQKQLNLPTIDYDEYKEIYLDTLKLCKANISKFDQFYEENKDLYKTVDETSNQIHDVVLRQTGLGVIKDALKKVK